MASTTTTTTLDSPGNYGQTPALSDGGESPAYARYDADYLTPFRQRADVWSETPERLLRSGSQSELSQSEESKGIARDWFREYATLMYNITTLQYRTDREAPRKLREQLRALQVLADDFVATAKIYGKIICSEFSLDDKQKTVVELSRGMAGGKKFVVGNILFKLPQDVAVEGQQRSYLYGGQSPNEMLAQKSVTAELRHARAVAHKIDEIYRQHPAGTLPLVLLPLMCTIAFRGYKLLAVSLLPLATDATHIYGTATGGRSYASALDGVDAQNPHSALDFFSRFWHVLTTQLNVGRPHQVSDGGRPRSHIGAADTEVHQLFVDGRPVFVVLDMHRFFPPASRQRSLSAFLRPELLRAHGGLRVQYSPDTFSQFQRDDVQRASMEKEVADAERHLLTDAATQFLVDGAQRSTFAPGQGFRLVNVMHLYGVNVRYLRHLVDCLGPLVDQGRVSAPRAEAMRVCLAEELLARCLKNLYNRLCRRVKTVYTRRPFRAAAATVFTMALHVVGRPALLQRDGVLPVPPGLQKYLPYTLELLRACWPGRDAEPDCAALFARLSYHRVSNRLQALTGVRVHLPFTLVDGEPIDSRAALHECNIRSIKVVCKHLAVVDAAAAYCLLDSARAMRRSAAYASQLRNILAEACARFDSACETQPSDELHTAWGDCLLQLATVQLRPDDSPRFFEQAMRCYAAAAPLYAAAQLRSAECLRQEVAWMCARGEPLDSSLVRNKLAAAGRHLTKYYNVASLPLEGPSSSSSSSSSSSVQNDDATESGGIVYYPATENTWSDWRLAFDTGGMAMWSLLELLAAADPRVLGTVATTLRRWQAPPRLDLSHVLFPDDAQLFKLTLDVFSRWLSGARFAAVDVSHSNLTGAQLLALVDLLAQEPDRVGQLAELDLSGTQIGGQSFAEALAKLPSLHSLLLDDCPLLDDHAFEALSLRLCLVDLRRLSADNNNNLTAAALQRLASICPGLRSLSAKSWPNLVLTELPALSQLTELDVRGNRLFEDQARLVAFCIANSTVTIRHDTFKPVERRAARSARQHQHGGHVADQSEPSEPYIDQWGLINPLAHPSPAMSFSAVFDTLS